MFCDKIRIFFFRNMKKIFLFIFSFLILLSGVSAMRFRGYLFYKGECPECIQIEEQIASEPIRGDIQLRQEDIEDGSMMFERFAERCGLDLLTVETPVLVIEDTCIVGLNGIENFLLNFAETGEILSAVDPIINESINNEGLPIVDTQVSLETAKNNTLIFIAGMTSAMIGLVILGYRLEKKKGITKVMMFILFSLISPFILLVKTQAFCPVCTVAVGAGLGFAKYLGIDDLISGIWIGGLLLSASLWLIEWLDKKKWKFRLYKLITYLVMYGLVIIPFVQSGTIGNQYNKFWGIDKVLFGIVLGTVGFILGLLYSSKLTKKNKGKVLFPFQKVVIPITTLILLSLIFYFLVY